MERVTYPSKAVQDELANRFERIVLDIEKDASATAPFKPEAIPVAVVLDANGNELARKVGFVPPDDYAAWLKLVAQ
jgi:thioredoxin-related protein